MLELAQKTLGTIALALTLLVSGPAHARAQSAEAPQAQAPAPDRSVIQRRIPEAARKGVLPYVRTELFFGTAKPEGVVTEEEFRDFIDREVTRRFPDGLTFLKADGQFRGEDGILIKEQSFVLILLYPYESFATSSQRIQRIRDLYTRRFDQQSVLRVDDPYIVWVSF